MRLTLLLLLLPLLTVGQVCNIYPKAKTIRGGEQARLIIGAGACFHYNNLNYSVNYSGYNAALVIMARAQRMANMPGEAYVTVGYDKALALGGGYSNQGAVVYLGYNYKLVDFLALSAYIYQTTYDMSHIVVGLKVII